MNATRSGRAEPLSPEDRRRSIIGAVAPLLLEKGWSVTTREMAEAAGVAEGTIFRVFPDKHAILHEAMRATMDAGPIVARLDAIDPAAPIDEQLRTAVGILGEMVDEMVTLMSIIHGMPREEEPIRSAPPEYVEEANSRIQAALIDLFAPHRDRLRIEPRKAAAVTYALIVATAHPVITPGGRLSEREIVDVLLGGIVEPDEVS